MSAAAPLSVAMREGSAAAHREAEGSPFMARLVAGELPVAGYVAYLRRLRVVYAALEDTAAAHADLPGVAAVRDPAVERLAALDADLAHWGAVPDAGPGSGGAPSHSPVAAAYAARIRASVAPVGAAPAGARFVAHHYTRYLGDLSGGQAIGRVLARQHDLPDGRGVAFYAFDDVPRPKPYKDAYRARLDALGASWHDTARAEVVAEVGVAFGLNQRLFAELGELTSC
ncbi:heme oxygenase (biliverdin-producing) [Nocardioides sp.]|uniref:biliverdin-producing heme oxygenase n=1 Tax=Nocardioides sp. TaxID=35761 RepID=UPI003512328C